MSSLGHDNAVMHVSNVMNIEAMEASDALTLVHISTGEAARALAACQ
jgi:hypothetical protein